MEKARRERIGNAIFYFVITLMTMTLSAIFVDGMLGLMGVTDDAIMLVTATISYSLLCIVIFLWRGWCPVSLAFVRQKPWLTLLWSALIAIGMFIPSLVVEESLPEIMQEDLAADAFNSILSTPLAYVCLGLLPPIVEEIVFRGAIQHELQEYFRLRNGGTSRGHWWAIIIASLLFSLIHLNPAQMPHALLLGLIIGWLYYKTGSILPGIVVHWTNNTITYAIVKLVPNIDNLHAIDLFGGEKWRLILAVVMSLMLVAVAVKRPTPHT